MKRLIEGSFGRFLGIDSNSVYKQLQDIPLGLIGQVLEVIIFGKDLLELMEKFSGSLPVLGDDLCRCGLFQFFYPLLHGVPFLLYLVQLPGQVIQGD